MCYLRMTWVGVAACATLACGGPSVGEILDQRLTVTLIATSSQPEVAVAGETQGGLAVQRAFVAASGMTLEPCAKDVAALVLDARGYDLLDAPSEEVTTGVADWCGIELDVDPPSSSPKGVPKGSSLYVGAQTAEGAALEFASEGSHALRFQAAKGGFGSASLLLGFDLASWLTGLPFAEPDMAEAESALLDSQLGASAALYADTNENGELDEEELTPLAVAVTAR